MRNNEERLTLARRSWLIARIVAVALLSQREVDLLGETFTRLWPVDETPCFEGLLRAIDEADRELRRSRVDQSLADS